MLWGARSQRTTCESSSISYSHILCPLHSCIRLIKSISVEWKSASLLLIKALVWQLPSELQLYSRPNLLSLGQLSPTWYIFPDLSLFTTYSSNQRGLAGVGEQSNPVSHFSLLSCLTNTLCRCKILYQCITVSALSNLNNTSVGTCRVGAAKITHM